MKITKLSELNKLKETSTLEDYQKKLQEMLDAFNAEMEVMVVPDGSESTLKDELDKLEAEVLDVLKEFEEYIKDVKYKLPKSVIFDGMERVKSTISDDIIYFLNKIEVDWQHTLGMYQLVDFWKKVQNVDEISYGVLDSTLRCLGSVKYKGFTEWGDVLAMNEYFKSLNEEYGKDLAASIYLSRIHSMIMDKIQMNSPISSEAINE